MKERFILTLLSNIVAFIASLDIGLLSYFVKMRLNSSFIELW